MFPKVNDTVYFIFDDGFYRIGKIDKVRILEAVVNIKINWLVNPCGSSLTISKCFFDDYPTIALNKSVVLTFDEQTFVIYLDIVIKQNQNKKK